MFKNTKIIILNENYRSTKNILFAANTLIEHNKKRIKKQLVTNNALGESIYFHEARNGDEEGRFVASEITDLVSKHGYKYNQIAILYRSNYLSREIEQQLIAHSLPYVIYGGRKFYERAEIKDLISYLRLLVNAKDEVALKRVINIPNRKIGMATLDKIKDFSKQNNLQFFEALKISLVEPEKAMWPTKNISDFLLLLAKIKAECENLNMVDKLKKIVDEIKYKEYLDAIDKEKFNNVESLYSSLNEYMNKKPNASLSQ
jgi:DNA helicase-2/ATP-dependent DNA helicase PcrA